MSVYTITDQEDLIKALNGIRNDIVVVDWTEKKDLQRLKHLADKNKNMVFMNVNVAEFPQLASKYLTDGNSTLPVTFFYRDGIDLGHVRGSPTLIESRIEALSQLIVA